MPSADFSTVQESGRLAALHSLSILETLPEQSFTDIVSLAAVICRAPMAELSFIDADRQWIKAAVGIAARESPRSTSFCAHTVPTRQALVVADATKDLRFRANPFVTGDPFVRAYAGSPIIDDDGHVLGAVCVLDVAPRDFVPEQVAALEALARTSMLLLKQRKLLAAQQKDAERVFSQNQISLAALAERLALSQAAGRIASWEWDLATDALTWTGGSEWVYGRPPSELTSLETVLPFVYPDDVPEMMEQLKPALHGESDYKFEFRVVWPDGSVHWLQAFGKPVLNASGVVGRLVGLHMDITERKSAESRLLESEKIATVGRLSSVMAHELNNPLASVTNLLFLAEASDSLEESRELIGIAKAELKRASTIASETLRFHKQGAVKQCVQLPELISGVLSLQMSRIGNAGIALQRRDRVCDGINCFEGEVRQVIANLLGNAIDAFTAEPKRIYVRTRRAKDWTDGRAGQAITIADTAAGMSVDTLGRLFDAFFTTKELAGTGLGLWVTNQIVQKHGGRIRVRSSQKSGASGTVFILFLPA